MGDIPQRRSVRTSAAAWSEYDDAFRALTNCKAPNGSLERRIIARAAAELLAEARALDDEAQKILIVWDTDADVIRLEAA